MKDEYGGGNTEKNLREPINGLVMKRNEKKWKEHKEWREGWYERKVRLIADLSSVS